MTDSEKMFTTIKPLFGIVLALIFVAGGLYLYFVMAEQPGNTNTMLYKIVGAANIVFFGGLLLLVLIKLLKRR